MRKIIGVRFRTAGKVYFFDPKELFIKKGDHVIVETARGLEYGTVVSGIQELEDDINENGYTEKFQQGNQEPYDRKRPNAETYKSFYDSYLKTVKQLTDMLPKAEPKPETDEFDEFISGRSEI